MEPTIAKLEQEIPEIYLTVDHSVAQADSMETVFTEERIERYQRNTTTFSSTCYS